MKTKDIVLIATIMALMVVFSFFEVIWAVPLIVGSIVIGPKKAFILSITLGVISLVQSYTRGVYFVYLAFIEYPWLPIVSRLLVGSSAAFIYELLKGKSKLLGSMLGAATASVVNTVCVVGLLAVITYAGGLIKAEFVAFAGVVALPAVFEIIANIFLVPAILFAIDKATKSNYILGKKKIAAFVGGKEGVKSSDYADSDSASK